jgi:hypothetical protein
VSGVGSINDVTSERSSVILGTVVIKCQLFVGWSNLKMSTTEQRANIKYCVLLHRSPLETLRVLEEAHGKVAMKRMRVCDWLKRFRDGRASAEDYPRCWRQSTSTNVRNIVRSDGQKCNQEISAKSRDNIRNVHNTLDKDLNTWFQKCSPLITKKHELLLLET